MRLTETGVLAKWVKKYWPKQKVCKQAGFSGSIKLQSLLGLCYVSAGLLILATMVFCMEIIVMKRKDRKIKIRKQ